MFETGVIEMILGAHESIAGGVANAFSRAVEHGCEALQIFTRNGNQWKAKPLAPVDIEAFRKAQASAGFPVMVHDSYLINLGGSGELLEKSIEAFRMEIERCEILNIPYLVMHPGAHLGTGEDGANERIARHLQTAIDETAGYKVRILVENTAGQGSTVGYRFEHLHVILDRAARPERMGICFDTQHAFASGYDLATAEGYEQTWRQFDEVVGLNNLFAFHLNDSKKPLGCKVDRHEALGKGILGIDCFSRLVNDARFSKIPGVLETPPNEDGTMPYGEELKLLRSLIRH